MHSGDSNIILLTMIIFFVWVYVLLKRRANAQASWYVPEGEEIGELDSDVIDLLEQAGYSVVRGKHKIPIYIDADGEPLESRLIIDGLAERDDDLYVIRIERERRPMEWTGSSIREHLLPFHLMYREAAGILYIERRSGFLRQVRFEIDT